MLIVSILLTGVVVGVLPGLFGVDKILSFTNIVAGLSGALAGAFLGFGDAPLFLEYPVLNEKTLMVVVALLFVIVKVLVSKRKIAP